MENSSKRNLERFLKKQNNLKLMHLKHKYDDLYFNNTDNDKCIEDWRYDMLFEEMERRGMTGIDVGAKLRSSIDEVVLPVWMGSLDKAKPKDEKKITRWISKNDKKCDSIFITDKLDGVSCLLQTGVMGECRLFSRGNGVKGKDITHILPFINNIPDVIPPNSLIRGELILPKYAASQVDTDSTLRNAVSGIVNAKTVRKGINLIDFVAYELIQLNDYSENISLSMQYEIINNLGFKTVMHSITRKENMNVKFLSDFLQQRKDKTKYDIDGIVVSFNTIYKITEGKNPTHSIAFKKDEMYESRVEDVIWSITKSGALKPRVKITPVKISGTNVCFTTGYNARYIQTNKIGKDAKITITKSGEIIPKIVDVITPAQQIGFPPAHIKCDWNATGVDLMYRSGDPEMDIEYKAHRVKYFCENVEIKNLKLATIKKLVNAGYDDIPKILNASLEEMLAVDGIGSKTAVNIYNSIQDSATTTTLQMVMAGSGIFDNGVVGLKKINSIFEKLSTDDFKKLSRDVLINRISQINGFSIATAIYVVDNIEKFFDFYSKITIYNK